MEQQYTNELTPELAASQVRPPFSAEKDGDETSTGSQCIAARPGMSVMGKLKLYIGDKPPHSPKCGEVGVIVSCDHRHSNSAAVAVDGSEIRC
ncbi:MAG: hypothetical protein HYZ77_04175, partial [Serratia liquefaciens]|nr:hypothetical protein [Serratia liquefaciens]